MAEENFDFNADELSFSGQMSEEEVNAFDFNLDKDLKLEGLDDISAPSFERVTESEVVAEGEEPQFDIDNLLDNISFDEKPSVEREQDDVSSADVGDELSFVAEADENVSDVSAGELTPSFMNEWAEMPRDDGNGDWKAPQDFDEFKDEATVIDEPAVAEETAIEDNEVLVEDEFSGIVDEAESNVQEMTFADEVAVEAEVEPEVEEPVLDAYGETEAEPEVEEPVLDAYGETEAEPEVEEPTFDAYGEAEAEPEAGEPVSDAYGEAEAEPEAGEPVSDAYGEAEAEPKVEEPVLDEVVGAETSFEENVVVEPVVTPVVERSAVANVHDAGYAKWFSGAADNQYFEVGRQTEPYTIEGNDICQAIHVNCSFDAYGWLVCFGNGMMMSLSDVREYQLRNGGLPDENGVIRYGNNEFPFSGINRIVIYQSVQYFSYGV